MILLENLSDYNEYIRDSFDVEVENSQREIITKIKQNGLGHYTHDLADVSETISHITGQGSLFNILDLSQKIKKAQLKLILNGYKIVINSKGGYFELSKNDEIEILSKYIKDDIKITRWRNGKHFYAKIGHIDVIDEFDNVKWNTEKKAKDVAIKYMEKLNENINS